MEHSPIIYWLPVVMVMFYLGIFLGNQVENGKAIRASVAFIAIWSVAWLALFFSEHFVYVP